MSNRLKSVYNKMQQSRVPSNNQPLVEGNAPSGSNSFNQVAAPRRTIYILFVGHFGCGKSYLIDICSGPGQILSRRKVDYGLLNPLSFDYPQADLTEVDIYIDIARLLLHQ
ncbi:unnamed protein product [Rhizoctonia solani]|uniref:Uncharacterized protein n=1 Tax=Rhizoctonia solani TaxID=456999 RepID=A0A8H3C4T1_9AGAM|nr:unnamed protein product [Rhizoctonia solani]